MNSPLFDKAVSLRTLPISRHPIVRMPVFVMGIIAGLQKVREVNDGKYSDPNMSKTFLHDIIPWGIFFSKKKTEEDDEGVRTEKWTRRVSTSFYIIAAATSFFFTNITPSNAQGWALSLSTFLRFIAGHYVFVHLQLLLIQGLVNNKGEGYIGKILKTRPAIFLGRHKLICLNFTHVLKM